MTARRAAALLPALGTLDRARGGVGRQLAQGLRDAVERGDLCAGDPLPSTRALAAALGVARGTAVDAFEQLVAEGYLEAASGSGTRVAAGLDRPFRRAPPPTACAALMSLPPNVPGLAAVADALAPQELVPFAIAVPQGAAAPGEAWRRAARLRVAPAGYEDPRGLHALREAIAAHVRQTRGVRCEADQVLVTAGTQQGLFAAARVLLRAGEPAWVEDPAYPGLTHVLESLDVAAVRVSVDAQGFDVAAAIAARPDARAAFVTPSHQYPLGMPLSLARRAALLDWARRAEAWVVEDDYDSELRYAGHPLPSLQGLDPGRVVYLGTFSKVLFPSLRLGYAVAPPALTRAFAGARALMDRHPPGAEQHALAAFLRDGHLLAHLRRIRPVFAERRAALVAALGRHLGAWGQTIPGDQGMHLVFWLRDGVSDVAVAAEAARQGVVVRPVSPMYAHRPRQGLMLGFGGFPSGELERAVIRLGTVLDKTVGR
jgi:GntR family transcriptional regulator/MocR family aminotransferase